MRTLSTALMAVCLTAVRGEDFLLSAGFTSDMVLQRAPAKAAVYGMSPSPGAVISVNVAGGETVSAEVMGDGSWKAYLMPRPAGGAFTVTANCSAGCNGAAPIVLERVTFGDVFFCSGQSNMALSFYYTFEQNITTAQMLAGKYANIRFFQYGAMGTSYMQYTPQYATTVGNASWYNVTYAAGLPDVKATDGVGHTYLSALHTFSATCLNFAKALVDETDESVPIGLVQSAVGGTRIEQWIDNSTYAGCANATGTGTHLYYGMVTPFVNMSINGWLWYQGENNCGGDVGNSLTGVGYGCYQVAIVELWRRMWSVQPGTTSPTASFGLVTLAAGGSEGHQPHISHIRWSQTGNYGVLPNEKMPNTYLAHAYDMGDPWADKSLGSNNCTDPDASKHGPKCLTWDDSDWVPALKPMYDLIRAHDTPFFMGPIHPRIKAPIGRRLAVAYKNLMLGGTATFTGPTLSGCTVQSDVVTLTYNTTLLRDDKILLQDYNNTGVTDSNGMLICTGASPYANASSCACSQWATIKEDEANGSPSITYCEVGPGWKPSAELRAVSTPVDSRLGSNPYTQMWQSAPLMQTDTNTLAIDLSKVNATGGVFAVRYGWSFGLDFCCADARYQKGLMPCKPAACPVMTEGTNLPGNAFFATIENNKCKCLAPQVCDA